MENKEISPTSSKNEDTVDVELQMVPLQVDSGAKKEGDCKVSQEGRIFSIVAPSNLRKGYRLDVITPEGSTSVVRVPRSAERGEKFNARECGTYLGRWYVSEFDCFKNDGNRPFEWGFCLFSMFCSWIAWGCIAKRLGVDCCGQPTQSRILLLFTFYATVVFGILTFLNPKPLLFILLFFFAFAVRSAARQRYKIRDNGNRCGADMLDCYCIICFNCCTVMQIQSHMKHSGENPVGCQICPVRVLGQVKTLEV